MFNNGVGLRKENGYRQSQKEINSLKIKRSLNREVKSHKKSKPHNVQDLT